MKSIAIQAAPFFELLRDRDTSMWEVFSQMVDGTEKLLLFMDDKEELLFQYQLPTTIEQLDEDRKIFAEEFSTKMKEFKKNLN